jgi:hypothetical protein
VDAVYSILHNPAYAGAFAYGRTAANPDRRPGRSDRVRLPIEEWATIHQGVYPAYISWRACEPPGVALHDPARQPRRVLVARKVILELAAEGHQDTEIARRLTKEGFRSARLPYVTRPLVEKIRTKHGQPSITGSQHSCEKIEGCWSVPGLARPLGTSESWLRAKIAQGAIPARPTRPPGDG